MRCARSPRAFSQRSHRLRVAACKPLRRIAPASVSALTSWTMTTKNTSLLLPTMALLTAPLWSSLCSGGEAPIYTLHLLKPPGQLGDYIVVTGINNAGVAVGATASPNCSGSCAVAWYSDSSIPLGPIDGGRGDKANAINNAGQIVGTTYVEDGSDGELHQAVIWTDDKASVLPPPNPSFNQTYAAAVNDVGQVVGWAFHPLSEEGLRAKPVVWTGLTPTLLDLMADCPIGVPSGVNNSGLVIGTIYCNSFDHPSAAVVWHGTTVSLLPEVAIPAEKAGQANGVNDLGVVVGISLTADDSIPVAWVDRRVIKLEAGPRQPFTATAVAINNRGMIVGRIENAVLWTNIDAAPQDLNRIIGDAAASEYTLIEAMGINDDCAIVVNGTNNRTHGPAALLLTLNDPSLCVSGRTATLTTPTSHQ